MILHEKSAFGAGEQMIIERLGAQIAMTLDSASLHHELGANAAEMAAVDEVARIVTSTLDIDEAYEEFAVEVQKLIEFDGIGITRLDLSAGTYSITHQFGAKSLVHSTEDNPLNGSYPGEISKTGKSIVRDNIQSRPSKCRFPYPSGP